MAPDEVNELIGTPRQEYAELGSRPLPEVNKLVRLDIIGIRRAVRCWLHTHFPTSIFSEVPTYPVQGVRIVLTPAFIGRNAGAAFRASEVPVANLASQALDQLDLLAATGAARIAQHRLFLDRVPLPLMVHRALPAA